MRPFASSLLLLPAFSAAACGVDFALAPPPQAGIEELSVSPRRAGLGSTVTINFRVRGGAAAEPVVTVGSSLAHRGPSEPAEGWFSYTYAASGQEPQDVPVSVQVALPGASGPDATAIGDVTFDFGPPLLRSLSSSKPVVGPGSEISLSVESSEPLASLTGDLREDALALDCRAEAPTRFSCTATVPREASGPRSVWLDLRDLAGNLRQELRPEVFAVDGRCAQRRELCWLVRKAGLTALFSAEAGAFEPLARVNLSSPDGQSRVQTTALLDGSVEPVEVGAGFEAGLLVSSTDTAGNACAAERPRRRLVAGFDAAAQGAAGGSVLRRVELSERLPGLDSLSASPAVARADYQAASAPGGEAAAAEVGALARASWKLGSPGPQWRYYPAVGVHEETGDVLLFGGQTLTSSLVADTLLLRGEQWAMPPLSVQPPARYGAAMTYDPARRVLVLFGGAGPNGALRDTWLWDGASWTQAETTSSPPSAGPMAFDRRRGRAVLLQRHATSPAFWEWDGADWLARPVAVADCPPAGQPTLPASLAYDQQAQLSVLLVRAPGSPSGHEMQAWTWDGERCQKAGSAPSQGWDPVAYYDTASQKTVAILKNPVPYRFEWSQGALVQVDAPAAPGLDAYSMAVWDPVRGRLMAFFRADWRLGARQLLRDGWFESASSTPPLDLSDPAVQNGSVQLFARSGGAWALARTLSHGMQVYRWSGGRWATAFPDQLQPAKPRPGARNGFSAAFDEERRELVLFGGFQPSNVYNVRLPLAETWRWSEGGAWDQVALSGAHPAARYRHGLAFDAVRRQVVLFGGRDSFGVPLGDTWVWDGSAWKELSPEKAPGPRFGHAMLTGPGGEVFLQGGSGLTDPFLSDLWRFDGRSWQPVSGGGIPGRRFHAMAYQPETDRFFVFGGQALYALNDAWEWTGRAWTERLPLAPPSPRFSASAAWDAASRAMVVLGGTPSESQPPSGSGSPNYSPEGGDTWTIEVGHRWPAFLAHVDLSEAPEDASLVLKVAASATGYEDEPAQRAGAEVFLWNPDTGWSAVGRLEGEAGPSLDLPLDAGAKARFVRGRGLDLLLVGDAPASFRGPGRLALDHLAIVAED